MDEESNKGLRLLSIDGGGVRGLSSLLILQRIMYVLDGKVDSDVVRPLLPCDYVDMIGGTSTGGLIAIMLGVLRMDINTCISTYLDMAPKIFPEEGFIAGSKVSRLFKGIKGSARFDAANLETVVKTMVADRLGQEEALLFEVDIADQVLVACHTYDGRFLYTLQQLVYGESTDGLLLFSFVCVTNKDTSTPSRLRNYRSSWEPGTGCTIWQAARATSAAPLYFPSIRFGEPPANYVDGGLNYNNPVRAVFDEANHVWGKSKRKISCVVSIGTGVPPLKAVGDTGKQILESLVSIAMNTQKIADEFANDMHHLTQSQDLTYVRLNVDQGLQRMKLEEWKDFDVLTGATRYYLDCHKHDVEKCANALLDTHTLRAVDKSPLLSELPLSSEAFFGRVSELDQLSKILRPGGSGQESAVIWGLGGFGKTRLALQYLKLHKLTYSAILWVNAASFERAVESYSNIAFEIKSRDPSTSTPTWGEKDISLVHRWLSTSSEAGRWLLVIDSIDDLEDFDCRRLVPQCKQGTVIVTTTLHRTAKHLDFQSLELNSVDEVAGCAMLLYRSSHLEQSADAIEFAKKIVRALDGVPLAIEQARAVLREGIPVHEFLGLYESHCHELMAHKPERSAWFYDKNMSISSTLGMVVSRLGGDEDANRLLSLCCCFGPRTVPIEILAHYTALENGSGLNRSTRSPQSPNETDSITTESKWLGTFVQDQFRFQFTINRLESLCLLKTRRSIDGTVSSFSLHNSLCRWRLETLQQAERENWILLAAFALSQRLPEDGTDIRLRLTHLPFVKHLEYSIRSRIAPGILEAPDGRLCHQYGSVTARFARLYLDEAYLREAEAMLTAAIQYETVVQGPSWPRDRRSLLLLKSLGLTLWRQGKLEGAAEALEALYRTSKEILGELDDLSVWAAGRLRDVRERINRYAHSERHAVAASTLPKSSPAAQAPGDEDTNLTPESFTIGVSDEEWTLLQVVEGSEAELGPYDRETLQAKSKLALFYETSEMFGKAGMWYEQVYRDHQKGGQLSHADHALEKVIRCFQTCSRLAELVRGDSHADFIVSAARMNRTDLVDMLLAAGAMANAWNDTGFAPLHYAAFHHNELMTRHLLEEGADVNAFSSSGITPLGQAVMYNGQQDQGMLRLLRLLISEGADVNAKVPGKMSVLCIAVRNASEACVELLLEKGAHVNADCGEGYGNALQQATICCKFKIIQLLLRHGADVHAQGGKYGNALQAASLFCNQIKVPKLLLENGAYVNAVGGMYGSALGAASYAGHRIVARFLLANGANPDARDEPGWTALMQASYGGHKEVVQLLLASGADINARDESGWSTLLWASYINREDIARLLIDRGADVDQVTESSSTALHIAASRGHQSMAQILVACGANVNARSMGGSSPLHLASSKGHIEVVKLLFANGADIDLQNNKHETALQIAIKHGQSSTKSLLLAHKPQASTVRAALPSHHIESTTTPDGSTEVSVDADADACQDTLAEALSTENNTP